MTKITWSKFIEKHSSGFGLTLRVGASRPGFAPNSKKWPTNRALLSEAVAKFATHDWAIETASERVGKRLIRIVTLVFASKVERDKIAKALRATVVSSPSPALLPIYKDIWTGEFDRKKYEALAKTLGYLTPHVASSSTEPSSKE